jgi:hypothetical protein
MAIGSRNLAIYSALSPRVGKASASIKWAASRHRKRGDPRLVLVSRAVST